jgi:hypothetical protein
MAKKPVEDDDTRIQKGLKFLTKADKAVISSSAPLERLENQSVSNIAKVLKVVRFDVGGNTYTGRMARAQFEYLRTCTGSLSQFANAIAEVLLTMNDRVLDALSDLEGALAADSASTPPPPTGCCYYDTNKKRDGVTQSYCEGALLGMWDSHPCGFVAPARRKRRSRAASTH